MDSIKRPEQEVIKARVGRVQYNIVISGLRTRSICCYSTQPRLSASRVSWVYLNFRMDMRYEGQLVLFFSNLVKFKKLKKEIQDNVTEEKKCRKVNQILQKERNRKTFEV